MYQRIIIISLLQICIVSHSSGVYLVILTAIFHLLTLHMCNLHQRKWESHGTGKQGIMAAAMQLTKHNQTTHLFVEFYQKYMSKIIKINIY